MINMDLDYTHAGAIALSKQPNSTRSVIKPPKFFAVQFNVVMRPHNVTGATSQYNEQIPSAIRTTPLKPKYFAVGSLCIRNPVGSSKNRYVT